MGGDGDCYRYRIPRPQAVVGKGVVGALSLRRMDGCGVTEFSCKECKTFQKYICVDGGLSCVALGIHAGVV